MNQQKKDYILAAVFVIAALVLGYFGISFPVSPEIPAPLPTATPVDIGQLADAVSTRLEMGEAGQSFTVASDPTSNVPCYMKQGGEEWVADDGCTWGILSGATLEVQSGATVQMPAGGTFGNTIVTGTLAVSGTTNLVGNVSSSTGAVTVTDNLQVNGNATVTGTLTLEGVAFGGPVTFGSATTVISGTKIAHGLATTPTTVLLTPCSTGGYTATVYVLATNATSVTVGVEGGVTVPSVYWLAGR